MSTLQQHVPVSPGPSQPSRYVDATRGAEDDPPEPWELPASQADLEDTRDRSFERLPHRPASAGEVPHGALDALQAAVGALDLHQLFVIPRVPRRVGAYHRDGVMTPTQVLAVGADALALWVDEDATPGVKARMPFSEVAAILDRNILLYGRLELVGPSRSIVVRYNATGRPELREMLLPIRRASQPAAEDLPTGVGSRPDDLPHKWMALLHSSEFQLHRADLFILAAGTLADPTPRLHAGIAVLSSRELLVATEPSSDIALAQYGVDLLAVPRSRVVSLDGSASTLLVGVATDEGPIEIRITADPSLVAAATATLGPILTAGAASGGTRAGGTA